MAETAQPTLEKTIRTALAEARFVREVRVLPETGHIRIETLFEYPDRSSVDLFIPKDNPEAGPYRITDFGSSLQLAIGMGRDDALAGDNRRRWAGAVRALGVQTYEAELFRVAGTSQEIASEVARVAAGCIVAVQTALDNPAAPTGTGGRTTPEAYVVVTEDIELATLLGSGHAHLSHEVIEALTSAQAASNALGADAEENIVLLKTHIGGVRILEKLRKTKSLGLEEVLASKKR